ncbi:hypothetical protein [Caldalkalibacillus salinus]|uniref:hypothetical protein n=1 Tax=Caldalkalibacillus salinus TaxID=2803787 RepID=UPI001921A52E|nr:hypothetical protein [Caldalkalibacillus salinus]
MSKQDRKTNVQSQFGQSAERYVISTIHAKGKDLKRLVGSGVFIHGRVGID